MNIPSSKIVIGLANGWALNNEKHIFFSIEDLHDVHQILTTNKMSPRGFMFWNVELEGNNGICLTKNS